MRTNWKSGWRLAVARTVAIFAVIAAGLPASAASLSVVYSFSGTDGSEPAAGLVQGRDGNFYGTTYQGGPAYSGLNGNFGYGTVFQLTPAGSLVTLHSFSNPDGNEDGYNPSCALIQGISPDNNFYGTASQGGEANAGTVYSVGPGDTGFTVLNELSGGFGYPQSGLLETSDGTLYGTGPGTSDYEDGGGEGGYFSLTTTGANFQSYEYDLDGSVNPVAPFILGFDGNLYGSTYNGGANGDGSIFTVAPGSPLAFPNQMYSFGNTNGDPDGRFPVAAIYQAPDGSLYITTSFGGTYDAGTVDKFTLNNGVLILDWTASFNDGTNGSDPMGPVIMASDGYLYGTTIAGGDDENGNIYQIDPSTGNITDVYDFTGESDGAEPQCGLLLAQDGYLYGTAEVGGNDTGNGTIYRYSLDPLLTTVTPNPVTAGNTNLTITVTGADFNANSTVLWNGTALTTTFTPGNYTQLTAAVPAALVANPGTATVVVQNADGGTSAPVTVDIDAPPAITSISPTDVPASDPVSPLTIDGADFIAGDTVVVGEDTLTPTSISPTVITVNVPASDVFTAGTVNVMVQTPDDQDSNGVPLNVDAPTITSINPDTAEAGGPGFNLTISGTYFAQSSVVDFGEDQITPTSISQTQIVVPIPAADIAEPATITVTVVTGDGEGTASNYVYFSVLGPPYVYTLDPDEVTAGNPGFTLDVNGFSFYPGDTVQFGSDTLTPTDSSTPSDLYVNVPAVDVASPGQVNVTVTDEFNDVSNPITFTINPPPSITTLNPSSCTAGSSGVALDVNGTNFVSGDVVQFGADTLTPSANSTSTDLYVSVPAEDVAAPGTISVTVVTSDGVSSNAATFTVNPAPAITSISPTDVPVDTPVTLTITGTNFVAGDTVNIGEFTITPASLTSTSITANVPGNYLFNPGPTTVTVQTADGTVSNSETLTVHAPTITSISPTSATAGNPNPVIAITGTYFPAGSRIMFGNDDYLTPSTLTQTYAFASVPPADVATPGTVNVAIVYGDGEQSNTLPYQINAMPTLTSISPTQVEALDPFTLTINGTNFVDGDTVNIPGGSVAPTTLTPSTMTVQIPQGTFNSGTFQIYVVTPDGLSSNSEPLTVEPPVITSLSPSTVTAGDQDFVMTINGNWFYSGSQVRVGTDTVTPISVTTTQITVFVPVADISVPGNVPITVGGDEAPASNTVQLTVLPAPTISSITPNKVPLYEPVNVTITGTNFVTGDFVVYGDGGELTPISLTPTQIVVQYPAQYFPNTDSLAVETGDYGFVSNSEPISSNVAELTSLSPASVTAGNPGFNLTINGQYFAPAYGVEFGNNSIAPTSSTETQMVAPVPASYLTTVGPVTVFLGVSDGYSSNQLTFNVLPAPTITSLRPSTATAGHSTLTLFVTGTNFISGDTAVFGSTACTTTYVSSTELEATVPAASLATAGVVPVTVRTPDGVSSNSSPFTVSPAPSIASIAPTKITAGHAGFSLTLTGANFAAGDQVLFGTDTLTPPATGVTASTITVTVPTSDVATAGAIQVRVITSDGVESNAETFTVETAPALIALDPNNTDAGGPDFTLTVNGTSFVDTDTVAWNGASLTTQFVSNTELTATVPAADITLAGTAEVTAVTADGVSSNALVFSINAEQPHGGAPTITSISPGSIGAGSGAFTLTITGTGFAAGDTANWNGLPLTTTVVSATQITADVDAADVETAGTDDVSVQDELGDTSNIVEFTVNPVYTFPIGLQLISTPYDYSGDALSTVIDEATPLMAVWNPTDLEYALTPTSPADTFHQGMGSWVRFHQAVHLLKKGTDLTASTGMLKIPLAIGWNMIGDPYTSALPLSSLVVIDGAGNSMTLAQANTQAVAYAVLYSYDTSSNGYVTHASDSMQPYAGYWICAYQACTLEMPSPDVK